MNQQALAQALMGPQAQGGGVAPMSPPPPAQPQQGQGPQPSQQEIEQAIMILQQAGMLGQQ